MKLSKQQTKNLLTQHFDKFLKGKSLVVKNKQDLEALFKQAGEHFQHTENTLTNVKAGRLQAFKQAGVNLRRFSIASFTDADMGEQEYQKVLKILKINESFEKIPERNYQDTNFANGEFYIQHDPQKTKTVAGLVLQEFYKHFPEEKKEFARAITQRPKDFPGIKNVDDPNLAIGNFLLCRYLESMETLDGLALALLANKLSHINAKTSREYGQPHFAIHPEKVETCFNSGFLNKLEQEKLQKSVSNSKARVAGQGKKL